MQEHRPPPHGPLGRSLLLGGAVIGFAMLGLGRVDHAEICRSAVPLIVTERTPPFQKVRTAASFGEDRMQCLEN